MDIKLEILRDRLIVDGATTIKNERVEELLNYDDSFRVRAIKLLSEIKNMTDSIQLPDEERFVGTSLFKDIFSEEGHLLKEFGLKRINYIKIKYVSNTHGVPSSPKLSFELNGVFNLEMVFSKLEYYLFLKSLYTEISSRFGLV